MNIGHASGSAITGSAYVQKPGKQISISNGHRVFVFNSGKQHGVVLLTVLVILVVMLLGAVTMIRSTDSATLVAGNLGFKQSGLASSDMAAEAAIAWLGQQSTTSLQSDITASGYLASYDPEGPDIKSGQTWAEYWEDTSKLPTGYKCWISWSGSPPVASCQNSSHGQTADAAGNRSAYLIQRLCTAAGAQTSSATGCAQVDSDSTASTSSKGAGKVNISGSSEVYYRITTRIDGPRNTVTYTQTVVAF